MPAYLGLFIGVASLLVLLGSLGAWTVWKVVIPLNAKNRQHQSDMSEAGWIKNGKVPSKMRSVAGHTTTEMDIPVNFRAKQA